MFHIALYQPEIPPNTGNIIRLCANAGATLHLIHPLGFELDDKRLRRAGLDYSEFTPIIEHRSFDEFISTMAHHRLFSCSTKGKVAYSDALYQKDDVFLFGPETRGLPESILVNTPVGQRVHIPMKAGSRSLNLSNSTAIILFEAWRQHGFN